MDNSNRYLILWVNSGGSGQYIAKALCNIEGENKVTTRLAKPIKVTVLGNIIDANNRKPIENLKVFVMKCPQNSAAHL